MGTEKLFIIEANFVIQYIALHTEASKNHCVKHSNSATINFYKYLVSLKIMDLMFFLLCSSLVQSDLHLCFCVCRPEREEACIRNTSGPGQRV